MLGKSMCRPFRSYLRSAGHLEEEEEEDEDDDNEGDVAAENEEEDVEVESEEEEEEEVHNTQEPLIRTVKTDHDHKVPSAWGTQDFELVLHFSTGQHPMPPEFPW